jgi:hypothetical protein
MFKAGRKLHRGDAIVATDSLSRSGTSDALRRVEYLLSTGVLFSEILQDFHKSAGEN